MNLFGFRKPAPATLVRAWCAPFGHEELSGELLAFVDELLAQIPAASFEGAVNDGDVLPLSSLRRTLGKLAARNAESLLVHDERGELALALLQEPHTEGAVPLFQVVIVLPPGRPEEVDRLLERLTTPCIVYAYARPLAAEVCPLGETRMKRSMFGAAPKDDGPRVGWLIPEQDVRSGAVRALYPVNVLSGVALARLGGAGLQLPRSLPGHGGVLWRLTPEEQAETVRLNPGMRTWLRFGKED